MNVGIRGAITDLSPQPFGPKVNFNGRALYDPLVEFGKDGKPKPALVQSWSLSQNGLQLTLRLRPGVKFSDGSPFNAHAVVWNLRWLADPQTPQTRAQNQLEYAKIRSKVINPLTVRLSYAKPMPEIFGLLEFALIVKPGQELRGVGTGPFKVKAFTPGRSLTVVRNPYYWKKGQPKLDQINFVRYADAAAGVAALESGSIDLLTNATPTTVPQVRRAMPSVRVLGVAQAGNNMFSINTRNPDLRDARVRQALSIAFNRVGFVKTGNLGYAIASWSIWPRSSPVWTRKAAFGGKFDLDKARSLLRAAGVTSLTLRAVVPTTNPIVGYMPVYQQDLAKIGVTLKIDAVDSATWVQKLNNRDFDLGFNVYAFADTDPALLFGIGTFIPNAALNSSGFDSPQYNALVAKASGELNFDKRLADYRAIDAYIQRQVFMFPIANARLVFLVNPKVKGLTFATRTQPLYDAVTLG